MWCFTNLESTDEPFTVIGLSRGTYSLANAITFVHMLDLKDILSAMGTYSYLMVDAEEGVDPRTLAARIKREVEKVNALAREGASGGRIEK